MATYRGKNGFSGGNYSFWGKLELPGKSEVFWKNWSRGKFGVLEVELVLPRESRFGKPGV